MNLKFEIKNSLINKDIKKISKIHHKNINGKIPKLGIYFVNLLYSFLNDNRDVFFAICKQGNKVVGFATFCLNNKKIYKSFFFNNFFVILFFLLKNFYNFNLLKNFFFLSLSSFKSKNSSISCELLSISVLKSFRRKSVASNLILISEKYLEQINVNQYIVRTEQDNINNNVFYKKNRFAKIETVKYFTFDMNLYLKNIK